MEIRECLVKNNICGVDNMVCEYVTVCANKLTATDMNQLSDCAGLAATTAKENVKSVLIGPNGL